MDRTGLRPVLSIKKADFMDGEEGAGRSGGCVSVGAAGAGATEREGPGDVGAVRTRRRCGSGGEGQTRSAVSAWQNAISSAGSISN